MNDETATCQLEKALLLIQKQAEMIELLTTELGRAKEQIEWLKRQLFGRKSERMEFDPNQLMLDPILMEAIENSPLAEPEPEIESQVAAHVRKSAPHGRGVLPTHLEREVVEIDIPEDQKILPDGRMRPCIGFEESEKLAFTPPRFYVKVIRRRKYGSPVGAEENGVVVAPVPESLVPRCMADDSLLAHVAVSKFADHLPAYRMEGMFKRSGITISRQTLCAGTQELAFHRYRTCGASGGKYHELNLHLQESRCRPLRLFARRPSPPTHDEDNRTRAAPPTGMEASPRGCPVRTCPDIVNMWFAGRLRSSNVNFGSGVPKF